jgi:hypothetical protein
MKLEAKFQQVMKYMSIVVTSGRNTFYHNQNSLPYQTQGKRTK